MKCFGAKSIARALIAPSALALVAILAFETVVSDAFGHPETFRRSPLRRPYHGILTDGTSPIRGGSIGRPAVADAGEERESALKFFTLKGGMCPYAARTWMCLLELGLPFDTVEIEGLGNKPEWYLKINPKGKVPAIQNLEDGAVVYESAICDEYLCDLARHADGNDAPPGGAKVWKLMPVAPSDRAALRLLNNHVDTEVGPAQFTFLMNKESDKDETLKEALENALAVLEEALVARGGPYLMGSDFTVADVHLLPFFLRLVVSLRRYKGYEVPPDKFLKLLRWFQFCSERDSVKAASPSDERIVEVYKRFIDVDYSFGGLNKNKQ